VAFAFFKLRVKKSQKVLSKSLVLNPSKGVYILRSVIPVIYFSYFLSVQCIWGLTDIYHTQLHSFLWMWTLRPHFWAKMFDVGDLPILTFGNCALKTWVIKWLLKLYLRFFRFYVFQKSKKHDFLLHLSCCTRFLEHQKAVHNFEEKHNLKTVWIKWPTQGRATYV